MRASTIVAYLSVLVASVNATHRITDAAAGLSVLAASVNANQERFLGEEDDRESSM